MDDPRMHQAQEELDIAREELERSRRFLAQKEDELNVAMRRMGHALVELRVSFRLTNLEFAKLLGMELHTFNRLTQG